MELFSLKPFHPRLWKRRSAKKETKLTFSSYLWCRQCVCAQSVDDDIVMVTSMQIARFCSLVLSQKGMT